MRRLKIPAEEKLMFYVGINLELVQTEPAIDVAPQYSSPELIAQHQKPAKIHAQAQARTAQQVSQPIVPRIAKVEKYRAANGAEAQAPERKRYRKLIDEGKTKFIAPQDG